MVVVVDSSLQKTYQEFELFGVSSQGGMLMEETNMLFIDCSDHFQQLRDLMSFHCPHTSCQGQSQRFTSIETTMRHLQTKHQLFLCKLCYQHRSLFLSEHVLYSAKELKKHMKSTDGVNVHPLCQFCSQHFYDAADLFLHMRGEHFTCRYCPIEFQHRYYRNTQSLNAHISQSHWRCQYPACAESVVAFASREEYASHISVVHNSHMEPSVRVGFMFDVTQATPEASAYLDLHIASADPNVSSSTPSYRVSDYISPVVSSGQTIPSNMRIAGKIKNGVLRRDETDDLLERALTQPTTGRQQRRRNPRAQSLEDFPALSDSVQAPTKPSKSALHEPHPLSAMTKERRLRVAEAERQKQAAEDEARKAEEERIERRRLRNEQMAKALGVGEGADVSESWSLVHSSIREKDLETPIYTAELVRWAKNNTTDLLRIERRLQVFLADRTSSTLSLKPMKSHAREMVRSLSKYYLLSAHEYDPEPHRYVALVKSPETHIPSHLLSSVCGHQIQTITHRMHELHTPSIYFTIRHTGAGMSLSVFTNKLVSELGRAGIGRGTIDPIVLSIRSFGPSGVRNFTISLTQAKCM